MAVFSEKEKRVTATFLGFAPNRLTNPAPSSS